jgi:hypothetical protein
MPALKRAALHPKAKLGELTDEQWNVLFERMVALLHAPRLLPSSAEAMRLRRGVEREFYEASCPPAMARSPHAQSLL